MIVVGLPSEVTLVGYGRPTGLARVVLEGDADDVAAFESSSVVCERLPARGS